jgi:predicted nucleic acid-binding Zn ribbon protein
VRRSTGPSNRGRWEVSRERCRIEGRRPAPAFRDACGIGEVIPAVMRRVGAEAPLWLEKLQADWAAVVGAAVARHTRPGRLDRDTLFVFVDSSVWLFELQRCGTQAILSKLRELFAGLRVRSVILQPDPEGQGAGGGRGRAKPA